MPIELMTGPTDISGVVTDIAALEVAVQDVFDEVNSELEWNEAGEAITADGTEQNTLVFNNPLGINVPRVVFIDVDTMIAGCTLVLRVYYRLIPGGGWELQDYQSYTGDDGGLANGKTVIAVDLYPNRYGVRVTLQQTAGSNQRYVWTYFGEL